MNLSQSRLKFRQRTPWEAVDLGRRLVASELGYYASLYAALTLPIVVLGALLFNASPMWFLVWIWWLKPLSEYGVLSALSIHAFEPLPPWKSAVKNGFRLMFQKRSIGDVTWRRFNPSRSFNLPVQQLEQLDKPAHRQRQRELSRYGSSTASTLTLTGNLLEGIWLHAIMLLAYWFLYGNFIEQALVQPNQMQEIADIYQKWQQSLFDSQLDQFLKYTGWAYFATLCFWGPFYVASGFTLYLSARVHTEAWDIRLIWQQLRERVRGGAKWHFTWLLALLLCFPTAPTEAETLPDAQQVQQNREQVLEQAPYYHIGTENEWCWLSCDAPRSDGPSYSGMPPNNTSVLWIKVLAYGLLAALIAALAYGLYRWWLNSQHQWLADGDTPVPTNLFGLDMRAESLPKNVSQHALQLLGTDPRAALSLLYRASLSQFINQQHLAIKQHHTEGQVLRLVSLELPVFSAYFQLLTQAWLHTAYGHQSWPIQELQQLCHQYAQHFEMSQAS